jgi:hypothetical protein
LYLKVTAGVVVDSSINTSQNQQFFTAIRCTEIKGSLMYDPDINRKPGSGTASLVVPTEECT